MAIKPKGRRSIDKVLISFGRHLVYTEGTKTEMLYVEDLKQLLAEILKVNKNDIEIIPVSKKKVEHTVSLVNYAIEDVKKHRKNNESINHVWIFYDKDEYNDFDDAYELIMNQNTNKGYCDSHGTEWHACWSNECFEVWLYHYFENLTVPIPRNQYEKKINEFLRKHGCNERYSKTKPNIHHFLISHGGSIEKAIKLMEKKDPKTSTKKPNPSSGVYIFAQMIMEYSKKKSM